MSYDLNLVPCDETIENDTAKEKIIKSIGDFIDKLILLEKNLDYTVGNDLLDPKTLNIVNISNIDELNSVANKIASFINLRHNISVNVEIFSGNIGGSICPTYEQDITININKSTLMLPDSALCVLAHELTHQYLFMHGIDLTYQSVLDNELLTDIAAIYLGLGNLILNGHRTQKKETINKQEITRKLKLGYVNTHYLGFVYKTICSMRKIPEDVYNTQLSSQSKIYIAQAMNHNEFSPYLKQDFFDPDTKAKTLEYMVEVFNSIQVLLNDIDKHLSYFDMLTAKKIEKFLKASHQKLYEYYKFISYSMPDEYLNERINFLNNMKAYQMLDEMLVCLDTTYNSAKSIFDHLANKVLPQASSSGSNIDSNIDSNLCTVICRNDGTKIPQAVGNQLFTVKCPKCGYQFMASTDSVLHYGEVKDFVSLYNKHFVRAEPTSKIIEDQGLIKPIFIFLKSNVYLSTALIFILIGIIVLKTTHVYFSLFFFALALVFILVQVFDLGGINLPAHIRPRNHRF
ncbi:MAG: hypothetical protein BWY74_01333 [Firmicutes bacterium ADurb.Bin419]|nr:MAG: hypothetical protein BWY74_01333 [Firmicutes bacterium ADurb.Bin419]